MRRAISLREFLGALAVGGLLCFPFSAQSALDLNAQLIDAAKYGQSAQVSSLIAQGASVSAVDSFGYTALMWAVGHANAATVQLLLKAGASFPKGFDPMVAACKGGRADIVALLAASGRPAADVDATGTPAVTDAALSGSTATVAALLAAGADIDAQDASGRTALSRAAQLGMTGMVAYLLSRGASPNLYDRFGYTALLWAAHDGRSGAVDALLRGGADISIKGRDGLSAAKLASRRGFPQIATAIQSHAAASAQRGGAP